MIYIASDHGGFELKEIIKTFLSEQGAEFTDLGPAELNPTDDYPNFAMLVGEKVSANPSSATGILLCRSGQGVNIVANKFKGVRAALVWNEKEAAVSRTDDLANVISIPTEYISVEDAKRVVSVFLKTPLGTEERHTRRVKEIESLEKKFYKD